MPILANDLPELRKFVYHNDFGQVHPLDDPESIAAAIDTMFAADLEVYRQNLRARCHEFTWEQQAGVITGLYERLFVELQVADLSKMCGIAGIAWTDRLRPPPWRKWRRWPKSPSPRSR